jgi:hypothetical protein
MVTATFLFWEFIAWFTHKYIMNGFLWHWHKSHHTVHDHTLERNDFFALVFSTPCIGLLYYATLINYNPYWMSVGIGIFCYGAFYFIFHDIIVHQRIKPNSSIEIAIPLPSHRPDLHFNSFVSQLLYKSAFLQKVAGCGNCNSSTRYPLHSVGRNFYPVGNMGL